MRIISGRFKGKVVSFLKSKNTRPLKDSVKENIFNILTHSKLINIKLEKSNVLDLYSGMGSFGLECLSRGANKITFVEKDKEAVKILYKNLSNLSIKNEATIVEDEINNFLTSIQSEKFEIFFLDPPFANNDYVKNLKVIFDSQIYKKKHVVIIHREKRSQENLNNIIKPILVKKYGRSKIIFGQFLI